ncbi:type IV toxin-antitoxin system AbiEi family antitoxin domain-containing protein [Sphingobium xenophagum]
MPAAIAALARWRSKNSPVEPAGRYSARRKTAADSDHRIVWSPHHGRQYRRAGRKNWLPSQDTSKTILLFASDEARKTLSRFRASASRSLFTQSDEATVFASDSPLPAPRQPTGGIRKRERDRAERVRSEGGPQPSLRERAVALARRRGVVRTKDLASIGVPRCYLSPMCDEGLLVRVGHGRYSAGSNP